LVASVIGWVGCLLLIGLVVYLLLRMVCIFILFPGSMTFMQRGMEFDFGDQLTDDMFEAIHCIESLIHILRTTWPPEKVARAERVAREAFRDACHCRDTSLDLLRASLVYARDHKSMQMHDERGPKFLRALEQLVQHFDACRAPIERALLLDASLGVVAAPFEQRKHKLFSVEVAAVTGAAAPRGEGDDRPVAAAALAGSTGATPALDVAQLLIFTEQARVAAAMLSEPRDEKTDRFGAVSKMLRSLWRARRAFRGVGNLDLLRAELCVRTGGESEWVYAADGAKLDCLFVRADAPGHSSGAAGDVSVAAAAAPLHIMILSSPNAGIFEYHHHQCHWIAFYKSLGISVVVWNYRGYGRSTGWPTPAAVSRDGETVLRHFREKYLPAKIGMHGESIGGIAATHVAANAKGDPALALDVLVCDRTFGTLAGVAAGLAPAWATHALRILTAWRVDNVENFLAASCYKVCANDPCDAIVKRKCALTALVAAHVELGVGFDAGYDCSEVAKVRDVSSCAWWPQRGSWSALGALRSLRSAALSALSFFGVAFRVAFVTTGSVYTAVMTLLCSLCTRRTTSAAYGKAPNDASGTEADAVELGVAGRAAACLPTARYVAGAEGAPDRGAAIALEFEAAVLAFINALAPGNTESDAAAGGADDVELRSLSGTDAKEATPRMPARNSPDTAALLERVLRLDGRCGCTLATALRNSGNAGAFGPHGLRLFVAEMLAWAPLREVDVGSATCLHQLRGGSGGDDGWRGDITSQDASRLGTSELKARLRARGVSHHHCVEKSELVALLLGASWDVPVGTWPAPPASGCGPSLTLSAVCADAARAAARVGSAASSHASAVSAALTAVADELSRRTTLGDRGRSLGYMLPLSCGHNGNYSAREKEALAEHLARAGMATRACAFRDAT
jgi:hypothetical protein